MRNSRDTNRYKNRRDKDIEANYSETEDSREDVDKFDSSPKNVARSKRYVVYILIIFKLLCKKMKETYKKRKERIYFVRANTYFF